MENKVADVPYIVHESDMARQERTIKRLWVVVLVLIVLLAGTNGAWIWYENQFEDVVTTVEQRSDGDSSNYAIGGDYYIGKADDNN